ncbi:Putative nickel insertion protein [Frankliniella fusca]|uniref:Nickel insertion protein n=1 Tax=Frankliniella fusca TaxID=407009 RepID=A0AAE1HCJ5_9NEOP|nr:Putative nickel insertion protein [Frankliniella fusca]
MADWKSSMFKSWFLYFSVAVLHGLLPPLYHRHYSSLVAAVQLLNAEEVSVATRTTAKELLEKFMSHFEDMYGREYMTLNFHQLLHLEKLVEELGPLWTTSCFSLESINGELLKMIHGTRFVERQIASSVNVNLALPEIIKDLKDSDANQFCNFVTKTTNTCKSAMPL